MNIKHVRVGSEPLVLATAAEVDALEAERWNIEKLRKGRG
jgi:hypothetical protein